MTTTEGIDMKRTVTSLALCTLSLALIFGCSTPQNTGPLKLDVQQLSSDEFDRSDPQKLPDEIDDIQAIHQDVRAFANAITAPMGEAEQALAVKRFREHFFSPWTSKEPLYSVSEAVTGMKEVAKTTWYGENRLKIPVDRINRILVHAMLDTIPSMNRPGIVITPTFMRGLPTLKPFYETADDFPFDQLQYTEVKQNEPVRILHLSKSGGWAFIETAFGQGWVKSDSVVDVDDAIRQRFASAELVVVVIDFAVVRDERGKSLPLPKIGTLYPLIKEEQDFWLVGVAMGGEDDQAILKTARIAKKDARRFPLPFNSKTVTHVGNELLKTPYGWGELFRDRDCSATTRDFFIPFGIWLPRNSRQQINSGPLLSLESLSKPDKEKLLREQGVPFRTLLHRKGHIMLYAGLYNGKPVILHNTWAIRFKTKSGQEEKFYIGRTVLTTLEAGLELPLTRGTILDHLDGMLILPSVSQ